MLVHIHWDHILADYHHHDSSGLPSFDLELEELFLIIKNLRVYCRI